MINKGILQLEGFSVLCISLYFYHMNDFSWLLFVVLLLVPDLSMIGYLKNTKVGAITYNAIHSYVGPIILLILGLTLNQELSLTLSLIWIAHIGMDRMIGYGLKYPNNFKDTHLQRVS